MKPTTKTTEVKLLQGGGFKLRTKLFYLFQIWTNFFVEFVLIFVVGYLNLAIGT